jgi:hypothetical protein
MNSQRVPPLTNCRELNKRILRSYRMNTLVYSNANSLTDNPQKREKDINDSEKR